ncbi:aldehyde dehydrogenase family protein [Winogradskyella luteola]|uniref:Aldehyde dehydrogenase n=1 Tax=Winogradskyella luteola TaxID=2828330 RepID=A0A9X1F9T7_9FLAO|nr:aldehyde dehydrogenase family protein [Winogradskyella luteola]MBV7269721.1 aldehyde dehydrogenase family protein [Winogradskyella luteola]
MIDYKGNPYFDLFSKQKENQYNVAQSTYSQRVKKLSALQHAIEFTYRKQIKEALHKDLKRPIVESDLVAVYLVIKEIKHAKANLHRWLKKQKVKTDVVLFGTKSWVKYEPKGVCLIISPWNYPINLTFSPLVAAIAAGNTVIIKPSEISSHCSNLMSTIIKDLFQENEIVLVQGDVKVAQNLLKLPFNHIFFTGSIPVGKIVMKAAAKHLTSVTLELGGKSPVIIDASVDIKLAAKMVVWLKHFNCGQTCIAPDYVFIQEKILESFIVHYKFYLNKFYGSNALNSESYGRIINEKHFNRLKSYLNDAKTHDAEFVIKGEIIEEERFIGPTVISNLKLESLLMQEEIFGPILPVKIYTNKEEVIEYLKDKDKPLALYVYSKSKSFTNHIVNNTRAGTTCINVNGIQFSNHRLPFGGSNSSGIGKAHGFYSFKAFSNERAVLKRYVAGPISLLFPPYTKLKEKIAKATVKWF